MWLAEQYAADVCEFFGLETKGSTAHKEAQPVNEESPLTALGRSLYWYPAEKMEEVDQLLRDKRQLIFYGPPGTGKTFVARALAKHLMEGEEPTFLQFHPSYSYEDFFEGFRPVRGRNRGMPQFALVPGPLKKIAQKAASDPLKTFVLVIDEINRGNLAKIFGELYFLLEYRDEEIMLQYGGQPFSLPKNLLIIGTMNTADRSISHIDAALRRRFHFFPLFPGEKPTSGLLRRYLAEKHKDKQLEWIADIVDSANGKLDPDKSPSTNLLNRMNLL
jgi:5-methylcytosine-specific restriction protein B